MNDDFDLNTLDELLELLHKMRDKRHGSPNAFYALADKAIKLADKIVEPKQVPEPPAPRYAYSLGDCPERYGEAEYESHRAAFLAAIYDHDLQVDEKVTTVLARYLEPVAMLAKAFDLDDLMERAEQDDDTWWMDDLLFDVSEEAGNWLEDRIALLFERWAAKFNVVSGIYFVGEDMTVHVVTEADREEIFK